MKFYEIRLYFGTIFAAPPPLNDAKIEIFKNYSNIKKMKKKILLLLLLVGSFQIGQAQSFGLKTNVLSDAFTNINLGAEIGLAPKWTLDIEGQYNPWSFNNGATRWKHLTIQPEARYWFCDRFSGHFLGVHAHGGIYNIGGIKNGIKFLGTDFSKLTDSRFQGWFVGGGIAYGYAFILGQHWNLEAEIGVGYSYTRFDRYNCMGCGKKVEENIPHHYVGPTRAAINIVYLF